MRVVSSLTTSLGQVPGQADQVKSKRLRRLARNLITFSRAAASELAPKRCSTAQPKRRLLYRRADNLTNSDLDRLVVEVGIGRWRAAAERYTHPQLPLQAAE
jgi:hypothetical protein